MRAPSSPSTRTARRRFSKSPTSAWSGICSSSSPRSSGLFNWRKAPAALSAGQSPSAVALAGKKRGYCLQLTQDVFGRGHLELPGRLDVDLGRQAIAHDERKALATRTHAKALGVELQSERARILAVAVREHQDPVTHARGLAPGVHDEHVVHGHARDGVDALGADLIGQLHETGQVLGVAGRGERPRHREHHHHLALEELLGREVLGSLLGHSLERALGHALPCLDRHGASFHACFACRLHRFARRSSEGSPFTAWKDLVASSLCPALSCAMPSNSRPSASLRRPPLARPLEIWSTALSYCP